jgi:hypothetical protein
MRTVAGDQREYGVDHLAWLTEGVQEMVAPKPQFGRREVV